MEMENKKLENEANVKKAEIEKNLQTDLEKQKQEGALNLKRLDTEVELNKQKIEA